jgi:alpha-tubulin suppressor-like RCC1 family protein
VRRWTGALATIALCACTDTMASSDVNSVRYTAVNAGSAHTCAMSLTGASYCWGDNGAGAVGVRSEGKVSPSPQAVVVGPLQLRKVDAGTVFSCSLLSSGSPLCWGDGESTPRQVPAGLQVSDLSVGDFGCGLRVDSVAVCWPDLGASPNPIQSSKFREVSVGGFGCGLTRDGAPECWQSGTTTAVPVPGGVTFVTVSVGGQHACGLLVTGELDCWGDNSKGQLGDFTITSRDTPAPVGSNLRFIAVAAGRMHSCAIAEDGEAYCWGSALDGRLGYGGSADHLSAPTRVRGGDLPDGAQWTAIAAGGVHSCGAIADGRVYCWGGNTGGQVGDGTTEMRLQPALIRADD